MKHPKTWVVVSRGPDEGSQWKYLTVAGTWGESDADLEKCKQETAKLKSQIFSRQNPGVQFDYWEMP